MATNVSRGAAAKGKTKKWLAARGYQVADLEIVRWVWKGGRPAFAVKKDQFASDLLAVGHETFVFVQVKSGASAGGGSFPAARREFQTFTFPKASRQIIIGWPPQARHPRIVECFADGTWTEVVANSQVNLKGPIHGRKEEVESVPKKGRQEDSRLPLVEAVEGP